YLAFDLKYNRICIGVGCDRKRLIKITWSSFRVIAGLHKTTASGFHWIFCPVGGRASTGRLHREDLHGAIADVCKLKRVGYRPSVLIHITEVVDEFLELHWLHLLAIGAGSKKEAYPQYPRHIKKWFIPLQR